MDARFTCLVFLLFTVVYSKSNNLEITSLHVQSDIRYRFATTLVTSTVANSDNKSVEAKFDVTLPDAAFITEFVMEIDGKLYPGEINEKEKAKKKYETAKKKGQTAGIVSQKPRHTNRFSVEVNVAAESSITFNLTYQELLERVYGEYEHIIYIDPGQIVEDFKIDVAIHESRDITKVSVPPIRNDILSDSSIDEGKNALVTINRPTTKSAMIHYAPTTDDQKQQSDQGISGLFVIEYDVERKFDGGEVLVVDGYFVHFFAPSGMKPIPKDILFILDVSGSMSGVKIQQQRDAMDKILQDLNEEDRFNIMEFSSQSTLWQESLVSVNSNTTLNAREFSQRMAASGGTKANDALEKGIQFLNNVELDSQRIKLIVFLTDGRAETASHKILKNVKTYNTKGITMFSLAFGNNADYTFIKKLAVQNKGIARRIFEDSDSSLQIKGFYDEISSATLQNLTFQYLGKDDEVVENVTRLSFDTFFDGKELIIAGKMSDDDVNEVDLVVTGDGSDGHIELSLDSDVNKGVPELTKPEDFHKITERIWAYLTIKQLLESAIEVDNAEEKTQLNQKALDLSLKYKFVTPLTSMVVTKPDEKDVGSFEENEDAQLALSGSSFRTSSSVQQHGQPGSAYMYSQPLPVYDISRGSFYAGGGPSGGSFSGGAGGDPHFMVRMKDLELPVCFNIKAKNGEILQLVKDPVSGVTINAAVVESTARNEHGDFKTFFGVLVLRTPTVEIVVKPSSIYFNGASLSWDDKTVFRMENVAIIVKYVGRHDRTMMIDFGNDVIVSIRRHMKQDTDMAMSYLNIYIEKETGISQFASGVLGELVHKSTKLFQITLDKQGNEHGHFLEVGDGHMYRFYTNLDQKQNVITGEDTTCWNVPQPMEGLLDENISKYIVPDMHA
ncbi:inter-alpha-trypsin inhibitor heavy chain H3-like [Mytilus galloprovincialis]|uniref:inter-alpha-trypsin inhibitor heavy chain H3-like n=1 Tax=Mytilus galloprovincialis TaxID=29158 RepID=UPI003F7C7B4A